MLDISREDMIEYCSEMAIEHNNEAMRWERKARDYKVGGKTPLSANSKRLAEDSRRKVNIYYNILGLLRE